MKNINERNYYIEQFLPLAKSLAWNKWRATPQFIAIDELLSAAYGGLVDAAVKFDPTRGVSFSVYAKIRIAGELCDYLRWFSWGSRNNPVSAISIDATFEEGNNGCLEHFLVGEDDISQNTDEFFKEVCKDLKKSEAEIVTLYYVKGCSLKEISRSVGISESWASKILNRSKDKISKKWSETELWELAI